MTDNSDIIQLVVDDLMAALQSIAKLSAKTLHVLDADELLDKSKNVPLPAAGVIYEGMRSIAEPGKDTNRHGQSAEAIFTILVAGSPKIDREPTTKSNSIGVLGDVRKALKVRKSPTGHIYRFQVESPADEVKGTIIWAQRWAVPVPMI